MHVVLAFLSFSFSQIAGKIDNVLKNTKKTKTETAIAVLMTKILSDSLSSSLTLPLFAWLFNESAAFLWFQTQEGHCPSASYDSVEH